MSDHESYARILKADILALAKNADELLKNEHEQLIFRNVIYFYNEHVKYVARVEKNNKKWWRRIFGAKKPLEVVPWMKKLETEGGGLLSFSNFYLMSRNCDYSNFIHRVFRSAELTSDYILMCDSDVERLSYVKNNLNGNYRQKMIDALSKETPSFINDMMEFITNNISWRTWD